jgi:hypothetical protein
MMQSFIVLTAQGTAGPRRLAAVLADRPAHGGQESQLGVDGVEVAHGGEA